MAPGRIRFELDEVRRIHATERSSLLRVVGRLLGPPTARLGAVDVVASVGDQRVVLPQLGGLGGAVVASEHGASWSAAFVVAEDELSDARFHLRLHCNSTVELGGSEQLRTGEVRGSRLGRRRRGPREVASFEWSVPVKDVRFAEAVSPAVTELQRRVQRAEAARGEAERRVVDLDAAAQARGQAASHRIDDLLAALAEALNRLSNTELAHAEAERRAKRLARDLDAVRRRADGGDDQAPSERPDELSVSSDEATQIGLARLGSDTR